MTHLKDLKRDQHTQRKKSVVLFADIKGYTAMMRDDESLALKKLGDFKQQLESDVALFGGKIIHFYGDGCLAIFDRPDDSIKCARILQRGFDRFKLPVRIGLHYGDILLQDGNVYGDAVNIASRIESMGIPGSILFSKDLMDGLKEKHIFSSESIGQYQFKYVDKPLEIYAVNSAGIAVPSKSHFNTKKNTSKKYNLVNDLSWKWVSLALIVVLLPLVLNYFSQAPGHITTLASTTIISPATKSIAIMPFIADQQVDQELGNALSDEIRTSMEKIDYVQVADKSVSIVAHSAMGITQNQMQSILNVDFILHGKIKISENLISISTQLKSAKDNDIVWSQNYQYELHKISEIKEDISETILNVLKNNQVVKSISQYPFETVQLDKEQSILLYGQRCSMDSILGYTI